MTDDVPLSRVEYETIRALMFAEGAHAGQKYGSNRYTDHLRAVYCVLHVHGEKDLDVLTAAILHDTIEDSKVDFELVAACFSHPVAEIVQAVTNEPGKNRAERHEKTYPKILANEKALRVKLADRIANTRACIRMGDHGLLEMYTKEWPTFQKHLRMTGFTPIVERLWATLDNLMTETKDAK